MEHNRQEAASVAIIGSADGPTGVFTLDPARKLPLKLRIQKFFSQCRRSLAAKKITPGTHTLEEVMVYAATRYQAEAVPPESREYQSRRAEMKENLLLQHKPELLGISGEVTVLDYFRRKDRKALASAIPDREIPLDFHLYQIIDGSDRLEIEIDLIWAFFSVSYSGSKKSLKTFRKIVRELYAYYGVSEADIRDQSPRYLSLLSVLSS